MRRGRPLRPLCAGALVGLVGSLLGTVAAAPTAAAAEVHTRPASGVFSLEGHGWGHGRGMSQWGAQGAASQGISAEQITSTYYPGTSRSVLADAPIRVWLQGDEGRDTQVAAGDGLHVTDVATGLRHQLPAGPTRWRATIDSAGLHLQSLTGATWSAYAVSGRTAFTGPLRFSGPAYVRVVFPDGRSRDYRGAVQAVRSGTSSLLTVNVLGLEDYLLGVVPRESSSSWHASALQAQSIAARSYSAWKRANSGGSSARYDICDTTQCQVYGGSRLVANDGTVTNLEPASTSEAVRATRGVVRVYQGTPIFAEYSSSNGGWSTTGSRPYLAAREDPWDGILPNPVHSWSASLRVSDIERRYPSLGRLVRMSVTRRDGNGEWGGRVKEVVLEGTNSAGEATRVTATGAGIYNARSWPAYSDGLRSSWWHVKPATTSSLVSQSAAPTLVRPPGVFRGRLTVQLRNSGTTTWPVDGLHLAMAAPVGAADGLAGGSTRPGTFVANRTTSGATTVAPGEVAEFAIALDARDAPAKTYLRTYRLRQGSGPLYGETVSWRVPVHEALLTARHSARPVARPGTGPAVPTGLDAPPAVFADGLTVVVPRNGSTTVRMQVQATGNLHWPVGTSSPVLMGTSRERNRSSISSGVTWVSGTRPARLLAAADGAQSDSVAPGRSGLFDVMLYGNNRPVGVTSEAFEPLWAGAGWLTGALRTLAVVRVDSSAPRLAAAHSLPPGTVRLTNAAGQTAELRIRLRNLGGQAWRVGDEQLGTNNDSRFALATSAWTSASRPPRLAANANRPGVSTVHPGEIGEWRVPISAAGKTPGTYRLQLRAIGVSGRYGPTIATTVEVTKPR